MDRRTLYRYRNTLRTVRTLLDGKIARKISEEGEQQALGRLIVSDLRRRRGRLCPSRSTAKPLRLSVAAAPYSSCRNQGQFRLLAKSKESDLSLGAPVRVYRMPLSKPSRGERDAPCPSKPTGQQHLYLIFDDWELGYSIRELNLSNAGAEQRRLPPPFIRLEATRGCPEFFAAVGTKILATHPRVDFGDALVPGGILPIVDVRSRGVNFAPGELYPQHPIYIPVGDEELFALDMDTFKMLSMKPLWPPRLEYEYRHQISEWSWRNLPMPTFKRMDVTSYAVDSDGSTILASTAAATFAFDPLRHDWKKRVQWSLPFSGRANFVHGLDVFAGLPKDEDAFGHLCFCRWSGDDKHVWFSKENLSSKYPAEGHVGTTLVYLGESRFCIVECVSNGDDKAVQKWVEEWEPLDQTEKWEDCPLSSRCRLTTLSLSSGMNGDLTAAKTAVQCYKVPVEASYNVNPVAFWL